MYKEPEKHGMLIGISCQVHSPTVSPLDQWSSLEMLIEIHCPGLPTQCLPVMSLVSLLSKQLLSPTSDVTGIH